MGSSSSKDKVTVKYDNSKKKPVQQTQPVQSIQVKSQELKTEEKTHKYNQTKHEKATQTCNTDVTEPTKDNINLINVNPNKFNQNVCEYPKIPHHPDFQLCQKALNICKEDNNMIKERIDEQKIDTQLSNDGLRNVNKNIQFRRFQQCLDNRRAIMNQRQQLIFKDDQQQFEKKPFAVDCALKMNEFDNKKQFESQLQQFCNTCDNQQSQQVAQKEVQFCKAENNQQQFKLFQQSKDQEIKQIPREINQIQKDYIDIYNLTLNKQKQGNFSNQYPYKHSICQTIAHINDKGKVTCENGCTSYPINKAIFNNKRNTIFCINQNKQYDINNYNQITNTLEMVTIIQDSLSCSNKTDSEKDEFLKKFATGMVGLFINAAKQNQNNNLD